MAALAAALVASTSLSPVAALELKSTDFADFTELDTGDDTPPMFYAFLITALYGAQLSEDGSAMLLVSLDEDDGPYYNVWGGDMRMPLMLNGSTRSHDINPGSVRLSADGDMVAGTANTEASNRGFIIPDAANGSPAIWLEGDGNHVINDFTAGLLAGSASAVPVYWNLEGEVTELDRGPWSNGAVSVISGNGNVLFGGLNDGEGGFDLARWSLSDDVYALDSLDFSLFDETADSARAVASSFTGNAMAGISSVGSGEEAVNSAFYWTAADGFLSIDLGAGNSLVDVGLAWSLFLSSAGDVVAGNMKLVSGNQGVFRWTEEGGAVNISERDGTYIDYATGMSSDASVIVGTSLVPEGETLLLEAFRWSESAGWQTVADYLAAAEVPIEGWEFNIAYGVSADGTTMGGMGTLGGNVAMYWLSRCAEGDDCGVTTVEGVAESVASLGLAGETSNLYLDDIFDIASGATGRRAGPTGGVYAYGAYDSDPMASAGMGLNLRLSPTAVAGITVGRAHLSTPLAYEGEAGFDATSVTGYVADRPDSGLVWEAGIAGASLDGTVTRGYLNGSDLTSSSGDTTGSSWGATLEAGWRFAEVLPATAITPYASYSYLHSSYNGWTETDGLFPATISDFSTVTHLVRVGAEAEHVLAGGVVAEAGIAAVHRETHGDGIGYALTGVLDGTVAGATGSVNWVEASAAIALPLGDMASTRLKATGRLPDSGDPSFTANATINFAF